MGLNTMKPAFRLSANGGDITALVASKYISLRLTDESGFEADTLEITLADNDKDAPLRKPPKGAELQLWLGYDLLAVRMGAYVVDEVELSGWPGQMVIRARSAPMEASKGGKSNLQTQKTRDWKKGTKFGAMVAKIAKEHGMKSAVAKSLAGITLTHFDQTEESDIAFLIRVAKRYDAIVKPGGGSLAVIKRGEGKTAGSDDAMPIATLYATDCSRWAMNESARDGDGTTVAYWYNKGMAKRTPVAVGKGDPVRKLRHNYPDAASAQKAAEADLDRRSRAKNKFTCTMPGDPNLAAEASLMLFDFHPDVPLRWLVTRVTHDVTPGAGYVCDVEAEQPKVTKDDDDQP